MELDVYLRNTYYFQLNHPIIQNIVAPTREMLSLEGKITHIYQAIRDGWTYSPFRLGTIREHYTVDSIGPRKEAHCIDKAILFIAALRAVEIPARLRLTKVTNHIAAEKIIALLGKNELAPHGVVDVYNGSKWVKCSPTFNKELCIKYNVDPIDFDGTEDAILQEFDKSNTKFMSYLEDYGAFDDVPFDRILEIFKSNYPDIYKRSIGLDQIVLF